MELDDYIFRHMTEEHKTVYIDRLDEHDKELLRHLKGLRERAKEIIQSYNKILETYSSRVSAIKLDRLTAHTRLMKNFMIESWLN